CLEWIAVLATERGDLRHAAGVLQERLEIAIGSQSMPRDGQLMATVAVLGTACGAVTHAARLMGATAGLLEMSGDSFWLPERDVYERVVGSLRAILGDERYDSLTTEGGVMPDDAITADIKSVLNAASGA
ncbi:MAG TPA: hypothetical protein VD789_07825, partial [Thermomicrobiales bacterium]|nr:hypothetical protein [Thermomicrobiales bacterium]